MPELNFVVFNVNLIYSYLFKQHLNNISVTQ